MDVIPSRMFFFMSDILLSFSFWSNPDWWRIFICFTIVDFPDSPAPVFGFNRSENFISSTIETDYKRKTIASNKRRCVDLYSALCLFSSRSISRLTLFCSSSSSPVPEPSVLKQPIFVHIWACYTTKPPKSVTIYFTKPSTLYLDKNLIFQVRFSFSISGWILCHISGGHIIIICYK